MKKRVHIYVSGIVQGVFFRDFTKRNATYLDIKGWVQNLPDGRVEVVAEGDEEKLLKLISLLEQGPSSARVDSIKIDWAEYKGEFKSFSIRRSWNL
jgi:acylphosphatase